MLWETRQRQAGERERLPGNRGCGADSPLSLGLEGGSGRTLHTSTAESLALSVTPEWSCWKARTYCPLEHTASPGWPVSMRGGTDGRWQRGLLTAAAVWVLASLSAWAPLPPKAAVLSGENLYLGRCNEFEPAVSMAIWFLMACLLLGEACGLLRDARENVSDESIVPAPTGQAKE